MIYFKNLFSRVLFVIIMLLLFLLAGIIGPLCIIHWFLTGTNSLDQYMDYVIKKEKQYAPK